tara:strand:+ start:403 stop:1182 length:780 start_codon:yes stop_codon:yes gene_type:complete
VIYKSFDFANSSINNNVNYKKCYDLLIQRAIDRDLTGYKEKHHIIPRCLGGSDADSNIVGLTTREHFICHALLAKMYPIDSNEWHKTNHAFMLMKSSPDQTNPRYFNSRLYEYFRSNFSQVMSKAQTGVNNSQYNTCWISELTTQQTKKISVKLLDEYISKGWTKGRRITDWNDYNKVCPICNKKYESKHKACSLSCGQLLKNKNTPKALFKGELENIISYYKKGNSIHKSLTRYGCCSSGSGTQRLRKILVERNIIIY